MSGSVTVVKDADNSVSTTSDNPDTTPDGRRYLTYEDLARDTPPEDIVFNCDFCWRHGGFAVPATCFIQSGFKPGVGTVLVPRCDSCSNSLRVKRGRVELERGKKILWDRLRYSIVHDVMDL